MLFERNEDGLAALSERYGAYVRMILKNILRDPRDEEECESDVWMAVWSSIPPQKPESLKSYVGAVARNVGINRYEKRRAAKRGGERTEELLEELVSVAGDGDPEGELLAKALEKEINEFLFTLRRDTRVCFVLRYYYAFPIEAIAEKTGKSPHAVTALLSKTRAALKKWLGDRGTAV
ncbi:MAG: RNA polymerase sigma factor [Clostridia bacterium]|nr:RNA polymerase sigma factor [Clostridia bacterium]